MPRYKSKSVEQRRRENAERMKKLRKLQTEVENEIHRKADRDHKRKVREEETEEARQARLVSDKLNQQRSRAEKCNETIKAHLASDKLHYQMSRAEESNETRKVSLELDKSDYQRSRAEENNVSSFGFMRIPCLAKNLAYSIYEFWTGFNVDLKFQTNTYMPVRSMDFDKGLNEKVDEREKRNGETAPINTRYVRRSSRRQSRPNILNKVDAPSSRATESTTREMSRLYLSGFNKKDSKRERKKLQKLRIYDQMNSCLYDERGLLLSNGTDLCDCLNLYCPGCNFPCTKCESSKCGAVCRQKRRWQYEFVRTEGLNENEKINGVSTR